MAKTLVAVDLFYSGRWNAITDDVYTRDPITITRGRPDESQRIPPSTLNLTLKNTSGKFSPRNPTSPLYGLIGRNTPIRVSVTGAGPKTCLNLPGLSGSYASTPDNAALDITGDIDLRVDMTPDDWTPAVTGALISKWGAAPNRSYLLNLTTTGTLQLAWSDTGSGSIARESTVAVPIAQARLVVRATLDVNNGAAGHDVKFYTGPTLDGPWTQLGSTVTTAGTTSIFSGNLPVEIGSHSGGTASLLTGLVHGVQIHNGIDGTLVANPFVDPQAAGTTSFSDGVGRTWTINGTAAIIREPSYRFHGEVESWPQRWAVKGDTWSPITANGITRRLNAPGTTRPNISALRRDIMDAAQPTPVAYWTLEEGKDAPAPLPHKGLGLPGVVNYAPAYQPGVTDGPAGTLSLYGTTQKTVLGSTGPRFGRGITLPVPAHAAGAEIFTMHVRWRPFDSPKQLDGATFADLNHRLELTGGGIRGVRIYLQSTPSSNANVNVFFWDPVFNLLGTPDTLISTIDVDDGNWHEIQVRMVQSGGNIATQLWTDGTLAASSTINATTLGTIREVVLGASATYDTGLVVGQLLEGPFEVSHVSVHNNTAVGQFYQGMIGHVGEKGADRITRLCAQNGIPITVDGVAADSEPVGVQRVLPTLDLLLDAAEADGGILYESRGNLGLTYRTQRDLYNQVPIVTLNYAAGGEVAPPLEPIEDTDVTANDVTVTRFEGGSATVVELTGPLNVQEPPNGVGQYKKDATLVLADDGQCLQAAAWIKHLGTWDEARYPVVNVDLTAMTEAAKLGLLVQAAALDIGDRVAITNPPAWLPPDSIEVHAQGFAEVLESHHWTIGVNATPAGPYDVYKVQTDTANLSRIPAPEGGTTLNGALGTGTTSVPIISAAVRWIDSATYGAQFPFDVMVAGERMRVTAMTGVGLTQTATVTRSINGVVKTHSAGVPFQLFRPPAVAR